MHYACCIYDLYYKVLCTNSFIPYGSSKSNDNTTITIKIKITVIQKVTTKIIV